MGRNSRRTAAAYWLLLPALLLPARLGASAPAGGAPASLARTSAPAVQGTASLAKVPLDFIPNVGQFEPATSFMGFVPGATVRFEPGAVTYQFRRGARGMAQRGSIGPDQPAGPDRASSADPERIESLEVRATFPGSRPHPRVSGEGATLHRRPDRPSANRPSR